MSEIQRGKLLGDLYFDNTPAEFVPPPIRERKALMDKREEDYLLTKQNQNELDNALRTLPYLPQSSAVYNQLKEKTAQVLGSLNADNYADKTLDVKQFANDFANKYGGKALKQEAEDYENEKAIIDKAVANKEIVDPLMADWYKKNILKSYKGLTLSPEGDIISASMPKATYAPYVDMQSLLDDKIKGWEADGTISKNPDGSIRVNKAIPGYLSLSENESISEEELLKAGVLYLKNDGKVQAYLKDKVAFDTRNMIPDAETLNQVLPPKIKEALFGSPNVDTNIINNAILTGAIDPSKVLETLFKEKTLIDNAQFTASKYSYNKEKLTTLSDTLLLESLKAQQRINDDAAKGRGDGEGKSGLESNVSVTIEPFVTQQIVNPTDIKNINVAKNKLVIQRKNLQEEINAYQRQINQGNPSFSQEKLDLKNKEQANLDAQIAELEYQQKSLQRIIYDNGLKAGVNLDNTYNKNKEESRQLVINDNIKRLSGLLVPSLQKEDQFQVDVSDKIVTKNGKNYIQLGKELVDLKTLHSISKQNNTWIYKPNGATEQLKYREADNHKKILAGLKDIMFDNSGRLSANVKVLNDKVKNEIYAVPTKEQFYNMAIDAYNSKKEYSNIFGIESPVLDRNNRLTMSSKMLQDIDKIRKVQGDFNWEVATPLEYLLVSGATQKSNLIAYINREKALNHSFKTTPEQYKIKVGNSLLDLGDYAKDKLGLPSLDRKYVDWSKSTITTLTQTDREHGQKYGLNLVLTKEGKEELNDDAKDVYSRSNNLKLVGVNPSKNIPAEQAEIQNTLLKTYKDVSNDNTAHGVNVRKQMGILYMENSTEGKALNDLNLYTLPAGQMKNWNVRGTDYSIISTTKDALQSDLMNVDFHLGKIANNTQMILAENNKTKESRWLPLKEVESSKDWNKVIFESPADIKAVVGGTLLDADFKTEVQRGTNSSASNAFSDYMKSSGYYKTSQGAATNNYKKVVKSVKDFYGSSNSSIELLNAKSNKPVKVSARVKASDLINLHIDYKNRISPDVAFPYVNKEVKPFVDKILTNTNLTITGGFRGESTHSGLNESSEDSLHKYGLSLDFRDDSFGQDFYNKAIANPAILKEYGIANIKRHGNPVHIHVEFLPNTI